MAKVITLDPVQMSYNTAISALEYRQHWERGLELLEDLEAMSDWCQQTETTTPNPEHVLYRF